ncbi:MAG TPA: phospholipid carrier-dependent glycosyltransferase [Patescibacteria group bacterium]|nr:phospholipid carrier-dependent glycosyltransferase [Patescibacteria group bacterium]
MKRSGFLLVVIILVAFLLRFWQLGVNPPSLTWDEVAWGYNAYSLGIDGKDEFGRFLPYNYLESFGDFKPPVYAYLDIIPVKIFGLNEFATRVPSAFFGVLSVIVSYFLVKRLFYNSSQKETLALFTSGILALSPWHIMLSRAAFEANVATFFIMTGVWLFLVAVEEKPWVLSLSAVSFVLSIYTFNSTRVVAPLLVIFLGLVFGKKLLRIKKYTVVAIVVGILLIAPIVGFLRSPQASLRFQEVNIFSDSSIVKTANTEIANDHNAWWSKIIHNRRVGYAESFLKHYFDNLSIQFLFIHGDGNVKFSIQDVGQMYLWELPFFIAGVIFLFKKREGYWWIVPIWLLLAIVPAATARETPHALRIESSLPTFQLLSAYGLSMALFFLCSLSKKRYMLKNLALGVIVLAIMGNFIYFLHSYVVHYPIQYSSEWQYGYKDAIAYAKTVQNDYDQIRITDELGRPYIYTLFYLKTPPQDFRKTQDVTRDVFGFVHVNGFDNYRFGSDEIDRNDPTKKLLVIEIPRKVPGNVKILKTFRLLNGDPILEAYTF